MTDLFGYEIAEFPKKKDWKGNAKASGVSNSQLYKQAGNSIVVACLCGIFSQLHIQGCKPWNDRTDEEKRILTENL